MSKFHYKDIQLKNITPLGFFGDVFRFEVINNANIDQVYFKTEIFTNNSEEAVKFIMKELYDKNLYLVKVQPGVVVITEEPAVSFLVVSEIVNPEIQDVYILFVENNPLVNYSDTPF